MSRLPDVVVMSDARVTSIPVQPIDEPLEDASSRLPFDGREDDGTGAARWLRREVADRLADAAAALPADLRLVLNEGYRPPRLQRLYFERYAARLRAELPALPDEEIRGLASRFVSPPDVAPHSAGAAADVLLTTPEGVELDMGCPIDASPEASGGRCYTWHPDVTGEALLLRRELARAMTAAGLVNYPTEWWHWSYGDRYWALVTGQPAARYGPAELEAAGPA
ncbi:M15 family metallopeptidase [Nocardioides sp. GCM10027113]|uniref:M15 family metallopeptidase n=1 Tax=unclassified Nocardioides TaxID=2615069 RepID=UPI00360C6ACD